MNEARAAAWNVYLKRVQRVVQDQFNKFSAGEQPPALIIHPPTQDEVDIIQKSIDASIVNVERDMIHKVLGPAYSMIDAIDNADSKVKKTPAIKDLREKLDAAYNELHAFRAAVSNERNV